MRQLLRVATGGVPLVAALGVGALVGTLVGARALEAQASAAQGARAAQARERVTRAQAVARAVERGPRLAIARADSLNARAQLGVARQYENPILALGYTKDTPQHHVGLDIPIDFPWLRGPRIGSATAGLAAARLRVAFEREATVYEMDTAYTQALSLAERARLSRRTALDADSLAVIARVRRDAGDVSELDVQLAAINAGQFDNGAVSDSLEALTALLAVQTLMGLAGESPTIVLADGLGSAAGEAGASGPSAATSRRAGPAALIAAAEEDLRAAEQAVVLERRRLFSVPAVALGFDTRDPGGQENAILPTLGLAFPLPLFNRNAAAVLAAQAQRDRADAELARLRIEIGAALARARRESLARRERTVRSQRLVDAAARVAALSLLAYREGASPLASVIEAQRTARDTQAQYFTDLANARNAAALVTLLETSAPAGAAPTRRNP